MQYAALLPGAWEPVPDHHLRPMAQRIRVLLACRSTLQIPSTLQDGGEVSYM